MGFGRLNVRKHLPRAVCKAAEQGELAVVQELLCGGAEVTEEAMVAAAARAANNHDARSLCLLLAAGGPVDACTHGGTTLLAHYCRHGARPYFSGARGLEVVACPSVPP